MDQENIEKGVYKMPYTANLSHREFNPIYVISQMNEFRNEMTKEQERMKRNGNDGKPIINGLHPGNFMTNFHF